MSHIIIEAYYQKMTLPTKPLVSKITRVMIMVVAYYEKMTCTLTCTVPLSSHEQNHSQDQAHRGTQNW